MHCPMPARLFALLLLTTALQAQSRNPSQPAPAPLPMTASTAVPDTPPVPLTPAQSPPKRANISYADGQLTISASNSSLNQILREVSRLTGIKITGGVAEERV